MASGCRDCKKCTNSIFANMGRNFGRGTAAFLTVGMSEAGMAGKKKCRLCGHQLSLHKGAESDRVQPGVTVAGSGPAAVVVNPPAAQEGAKGSAKEQLKELKSLKDAGLISAAEFAQKRTEILKRL